MKNYKKNICMSLVLTMSILIGCPQDKVSIIEIETQDGLQTLLTKSQGPIVISLYKEGCQYCDEMEPILNEIANDPIFEDIGFYRGNGSNIIAAASPAEETIKNIVHHTIKEKRVVYPLILFMYQGKHLDNQVGATSGHHVTKKIEKCFPGMIN